MNNTSVCKYITLPNIKYDSQLQHSRVCQVWSVGPIEFRCNILHGRKRGGTNNSIFQPYSYKAMKIRDLMEVTTQK